MDVNVSRGGSDDLGTLWFAIVVPEPSSFVLGGTALLGLCALVWRRRRSGRFPTVG